MMTLKQKNPHQNNQIPLTEQLLQMIFGTWITQSIYVAAKLSIADLLKDGDKSCEELAKSTEVDASSLYRVLRALSSIGIFVEVENRHFQLTPLAQYLRSDIPGSFLKLLVSNSLTLSQPNPQSVSLKA